MNSIRLQDKQQTEVIEFDSNDDKITDLYEKVGYLSEQVVEIADRNDARDAIIAQLQQQVAELQAGRPPAAPIRQGQVAAPDNAPQVQEVARAALPSATQPGQREPLLTPQVDTLQPQQMAQEENQSPRPAPVPQQTIPATILISQEEPVPAPPRDLAPTEPQPIVAVDTQQILIRTWNIGNTNESLQLVKVGEKTLVGKLFDRAKNKTAQTGIGILPHLPGIQQGAMLTGTFDLATLQERIALAQTPNLKFPYIFQRDNTFMPMYTGLAGIRTAPVPK